MTRVVDLRSDTVTQPTPAMRAVMAAAPVGDDCYGDDPSVAALEQSVATMLGKDDALFLPSGTMSNQLAVRVHARPGQVIACHRSAHVFIHEDASAAALSGVQLSTLGDRTGYRLEALQELVRDSACGWPPVAAVWFENTLGDAGGQIWPLEELRALSEWARDHALTVHLDGARLWNAHTATGTSLRDLAAVADTVNVSLSKGLGAPAGSVLSGNQDAIARARAMRHGLGGSMRQAGVLAAAALHALETQLDRLQHDHRRARTLAAALRGVVGLRVHNPQTNMVLATFDAAPAEHLCAALRDAGVLCHPNRHHEVRWVLHLDIDDDKLAWAIDTIRRVTQTVLGAPTS